VLIPATGNEADAHCLLERLDGILLTGSRSHIAPRHYGGQAPAADAPHDHARDATTLPLIRAAIARGVPVLAICRGMQELNVALGGTLFQHLPALPGRLNHAAAQPEDSVGRIAPAHAVILTRGGLLHRLAQAPSIEVNSLHHQGIDRLGEGLAIEAVAPDGTIESVRAVHCGGFAVGVQWHPEFDAASNPISGALFRAFGQAMLHRNGAEALAAD
jgi:putative glutamine amidotransferase